MKRIIQLITVLLFSAIQSYGQSLDSLLSIAAENNPDLKATYLNFEASMKRVTQVNALPDPTISFGYFISPIETRVGPQRAKISLIQMFPWFGTLKAKEEVTTLMAESKYQDFLDDKNKLFFKVKQIYYPLYAIDEQIKWQEENLTILNSYKKLATTSFSNGKGAMTDVLRVDIMIEDVQTEIELLQDKKRPLTIQFNRLLNRPDSISIEFEDSLSISLPDMIAERDSIFANNPQLQALQLKLEAMQKKEVEAKKSGTPQIGIGLDYAIVSERTDMNVPDNGKNAFMPMVTMSLPIFRKKYKSSIEEAQLMQQVYEHKKVGLQNSLMSSYENSVYELESTSQLDSLYGQQIEKMEQVLKLLYSAYSNSGKDFEEVLRMQQKLIKYELAKTNNLTQFYLALAQLEYLTAKSQ